MSAQVLLDSGMAAHASCALAVGLLSSWSWVQAFLSVAEGLGFRVQGLGFRVSGFLGFRVSDKRNGNAWHLLNRPGCTLCSSDRGDQQRLLCLDNRLCGSRPVHQVMEVIVGDITHLPDSTRRDGVYAASTSATATAAASATATATAPAAAANRFCDCCCDCDCDYC